MSAKDIRVDFITQRAAAALVKRFHYSGKVTSNSQLHFGVWIGDRLEGALQFGPPIDKRKMQGLVPGTEWNAFLELNRMAFGPALPRNSESRALAVCFRLIRRHYPQIEWVVSFADGTQCGDGTIYRAAGFLLTDIKRNTTLLRMPDGSICADKTLNDHPTRKAGWWKKQGAKPLEGFQLRYLYFLSAEARQRYDGPVLPYSAIAEAGAGMYLGEKRTP